MVKRTPPVKRTVLDWTDEVNDKLYGCFGITDWTIFEECASSIDELTETVDECLHPFLCLLSLCMAPSKKVTIRPNSKPWITKELLGMIKDKHKAVTSQNKPRLREIPQELEAIQQAKTIYKAKIEANLKEGNSRATWQGLQLMTGYGSKNNKTPEVENVEQWIEDLNMLYARFEDVHVKSYKPVTVGLWHVKTPTQLKLRTYPKYSNMSMFAKQLAQTKLHRSS